MVFQEKTKTKDASEEDGLESKWKEKETWVVLGVEIGVGKLAGNTPTQHT